MEAMHLPKKLNERLFPVVSRKQWIDALRALAILFVILGHQIHGMPAFFVFTSPIKIPLFFMITGYVFNDSRLNVRDFFLHLFCTIIVPWFCLTIPFALIKIPSQGLSALWTTVTELISGEMYWYMPCCVIAEIIWFFIRKYARKEHLTCICALALFALGILAMQLNILNYAMLNRALIMLLFILMGFLFRTHEDKIDKIKGVYILLFCAIYILLGCVSLAVWPNETLDVHKNYYYNIPFCFGMMVFGCFTAFLAARKKNTAPAVLCFIGQNTLVYYLLHGYIITAAEKVFSRLGIGFPDTLVFAFIRTLIGCVGCWLVSLLLSRFLPEAIGKKRAKKALKKA